MTIDTLNIAITIGKLLVFTILFAYLLRKTDWKQEANMSVSGTRLVQKNSLRTPS